MLTNCELGVPGRVESFAPRKITFVCELRSVTRQIKTNHHFDLLQGERTHDLWKFINGHLSVVTIVSPVKYVELANKH